MAERKKVQTAVREANTRSVPTFDAVAGDAGGLVLTVAFHHETRRIGGEARLLELDDVGGQAALSRLEPDFAQPGRPEHCAPIESSFTSRKPIVLRREADGSVTLDLSQTSTKLTVDGHPVDGAVRVSEEALDRGVLLELSGAVTLVLRRRSYAGPRPARTHGLIGESEAICDVRRAIDKAAVGTGPVLIQGETGTGKELVARALHEAGPRRGRTWLPVNMAAIPRELAASELFGHARGAFSGAAVAREGWFERADQGTLFLDEVGDTSLDVQASLLRVLETGEIQKVGTSTPRRVDVRLVAATDADLEHLIAEGRFRAPLFYRLATHEIRLPPLRERITDVGRLLLEFLREVLAETGREHLLTTALADGRGWLRAPVVTRLCLHPWPGNVRQLRNVARYLASLAGGPPVRPDDTGLVRLLPEGAPQSTTADVPRATTPAASIVAAPAPPTTGRAREVTSEDIQSTLAEHDYRLGPTARALGISRPHLNKLVDAHPKLQRASTLDTAPIRAALDEADGDLAKAARALRVSRRGLKLRMRELGMDPTTVSR